jgi:hypothetical protein
MGYYKDSRGIQNFTPDDTPDELYIESYGGRHFADILDAMRGHFGYDLDLNDFAIAAEKIHTHCLGFDLYDHGDYTDYLHITRVKS